VPPAGSRSPSTEAEIAEFLTAYPPRIARHAQSLRRIVHKAVPPATERIRPGWRLLGYDLPLARSGTFFAWIWPELEHVHVGWEVGTLLADPDRRLHGADLKLKKVRYLTYAPDDRIESEHVIEFTRQAAAIASMSRAERDLVRIARTGASEAA
jgi:hypothetical protein